MPRVLDGGRRGPAGRAFRLLGLVAAVGCSATDRRGRGGWAASVGRRGSSWPGSGGLRCGRVARPAHRGCRC